MCCPVRLAAPLTACLVTLSLTGCGGDAPQAKAPITPARAPSKIEQVVTPAAPVEAKVVQAPYSPPYPERKELFIPTQRAKNLARHTGGEFDDGVNLVGFVTVDEPRAVLTIDGVATSLAAGSQKYGIEVISITPPKAVLQRGRTRWTASLE
jgi:hypothetical protein